eukprot:s242_g2.t1
MLQPQSKSPKQIENEERVQAREALQQRTKELARKRAVSQFRELLRHRYGSVVAGWRQVLDIDGEGEVTWEAFEDAAKTLQFTGDKDGLWEDLATFSDGPYAELVEEHEETLTLERLEPAVVEAKASFLHACADRYGSVEKAFWEMELETKPLVSHDDFNRLCIEINMQKNRRLLFEYVDLKGATLDADACKNVFGKIACKEAQAQLAERSPEKKERKTIHRRAVEQCALTHRAPEELRQRRQEIVELLEDRSCCFRHFCGKSFGQVLALLRAQARFDSPVRAWANLLDLHAKGKLKRREFQTSMSVLGYAGNVKKLWEEMGLKPKQSVRFKDLCPEVIDEIREFKNMAGKKIITLIQVSEVAAGPGKSKKAGVPVDTDEYYKVIDAIDYPGDAERLLRHLDPGNMGYVNTRTLRILNEQKSEEKAVPQYLKKYRENKQTQLEQKIASVIMPPVRELLAKQEHREWSSKKEVRDARENFIRALTDKFGSLAKAWRLALDPELKMVIENVDQLMKGPNSRRLRRSGQMPDGGEHALRLKAEKIFQACQNKETEQIALEDLDPRTPAMLEKFKDLCEHRFGSLQDAFEAIDVEGDFRQLCHEIKLTDGMFRLLEFLDPKRTGEVRLSLIDREVAEDAMKSTKLGKKAILEVRRRLVKRFGTITRAWKKVQGKATKEIGRDGWLSFFEEVGMQNQDAHKAWELLPVEEDKLSLTLFEPGIGRDLEAFHQKIIERFRSAKNMMLKMRDGGASLDKKRFLEVCYECQTTGNENRLFEYLEDGTCVEASVLSRTFQFCPFLGRLLAVSGPGWPTVQEDVIGGNCSRTFVSEDAEAQSQENGEVNFERIDEKAKRKEEEKRAARRERLQRKKEKEKEQKKARAAAKDGDSASDGGSPRSAPQSPKAGSSPNSRVPSPAATARPEAEMTASCAVADRPGASRLGHETTAGQAHQVKLFAGRRPSMSVERRGLSWALEFSSVTLAWRRRRKYPRDKAGDHHGNLDMNLIHTLMSVETQGAERCRTRVRKKLDENPTMAWYEEVLRIEEERLAQLWATELVDPEDEEGSSEEVVPSRLCPHIDMNMDAALLQQTLAQAQVTLASTLANAEETDYSDKYCDDIYEYRRVTVPRHLVPSLPGISQGRTMEEWEWRQCGITMSRGWEHYDHHSPEANVLLFRRVLGTDPKTGQIPPQMQIKVAERLAYIEKLEQVRLQMIQEQARKQEQYMNDMYF